MEYMCVKIDYELHVATVNNRRYTLNEKGLDNGNRKLIKGRIKVLTKQLFATCCEMFWLRVHSLVSLTPCLRTGF